MKNTPTSIYMIYQHVIFLYRTPRKKARGKYARGRESECEVEEGIFVDVYIGKW
jgi:hypothetical protein